MNRVTESIWCAMAITAISVPMAQAQTVTAKGFYSQTANAQLRNEFMLQLNDLRAETESLRTEYVLQMNSLRTETENLGSRMNTVQSQLRTALQELSALREEVRWLRERVDGLSAAPATASAPAPVTGSAVAPAPAGEPAPAICATSTFPNSDPHLGHCRVVSAAHGQSSGACQYSYGICRYRCVAGIWTKETHNCFDPSVHAGSQ